MKHYKAKPRFKLWVGGEFERTCNSDEVKRLLAEQDKSQRITGKIIVISCNVTAVRIGK